MNKAIRKVFSFFKAVLIFVLGVLALIVAWVAFFYIKNETIDRDREAVLIISTILGECNSTQAYNVDSVIVGGWRLEDKTIHLANRKDTIIGIDDKKKYLVKGTFTFYEESTEFYCSNTYRFKDEEFKEFK